MQPSSLPKSYTNRVLASLPSTELHQLAPYLSPVDLPRDFTLHEQGQLVDTVYFLEAGICSIVAMMKDGMTVEVGIIGRDGFVGTAAILGSERSPNRCFMQIEGHGFKVKAKILNEQVKLLTPFGFACCEACKR